MMACPENLNDREAEELIRWFTYWMPMDRRGELMGTMPVTYAKLFPGVSPAAIERNVRAEVRKASQAQNDKAAAALDRAAMAEFARGDCDPELDPAYTEPPF